MARLGPVQPAAVAAVRAAFSALVLGIIGGLAVATVVLTRPAAPPTTVADALGLEASAGPHLDARRAAGVAALTAACMARRGLSWRPVLEPTPSIPDPELDPVAWASRWGFGLSTMVGLAQPPDLPDPNLERLVGATENERARYAAALYGEPAGEGCQSEARVAVFGLRDRLLGPLRGALTALEQAIEADHRVVAVTDAWRACVAGLADAVGEPRPERGTFTLGLMTAFQERTVTSMGDAASLSRIQADERRTATTLARCDMTLDDARRSIAAEREAAFVSAHRHELAAIGAAIRAAEAALPVPPDPDGRPGVTDQSATGP